MRLLLLLALLLALTACSTPSPFAPVAGPPEAPIAEALEDELCHDVAVHLMASERQNYSLAAEYYRNAQNASSAVVRRDSYCAAVSSLRWLIDNAPLYTGGKPDDRSFLRLANVYETLADGDERRARLDSALALRARGLRLLLASGGEPDVWARDLREGLFFFANADAYPDAVQREYLAFRRAFKAQPDSLDDWYLRRLATASGEFIEAPEARADFLEALSEPMEDVEYAAYLMELADMIRTPPVADPPAFADSPLSDLQPLLAAFARGDYADCEPVDDIRTLIGTASRLPERVREAGNDPDEVVGVLLDCFTDDIAEPAQLFSLFVRSWRRGDRDQAEDYYSRALANAASGAQRADFAYARGSRGYGDAARFYREAVGYQSTHAPSRFALAREKASGVRTSSDVRDRAVYSCLADDFREIAAIGHPQVTPLARRTAEGYERSAPDREAYIFQTDWKPGDTIRVSYGGVSCTTRVR